MSYTTNLEIQDEIIGKMGLGVDYYKGEQGEQGIPGKDGKDGSDQVYVGADEPTDERVKLWIDTDATPSSGGAADSIDWSKVQNKPNFADVATSGDYNDLSNKPTIPSVEGLASETYVNEKVAAIVIPEVPTKVSELENDKGYLTEHQSLAEYAKKTDIPAPYTLPTASTSTLGGVKVDGNTITIADGVISSVGSTEPDAYIKDASVSGDTLTLTKKDDTEVVFTPSGSGGDTKIFVFSSLTGNLTDQERENLQYCVDNLNEVIFTIDNQLVVSAKWQWNNWFFVCLSYDNAEEVVREYTIGTINDSTTITGSRIGINKNAILITNNNINNFSSHWEIASDWSDGNLYNARELAILFKNSDGECFSYYYNFNCSFDSMWDTGGLGMYANKNFIINTGKNQYGNWYYDGSQINFSGNSPNNYRIYYKT